MGVPCRILHNPNDKYYGLGIFESKIDILDDIDQALSQASQTVKVSTPVEYYPTSLLEKTPDGNPVLPKAYNRQFIEAPRIYLAQMERLAGKNTNNATTT